MNSHKSAPRRAGVSLRPRTARSHVAYRLLAGLLLATGCADAPEEEDVPVQEERQFSLQADGDVDNAIQSSCDTSAVLGLSRQLVAQMGCNGASALVELPARRNLLGSSTPTLLQPAASAALLAALDARPGSTLTVNSSFRTVAQQYLLYRWGQQKRCGSTTPAAPGRSNHESGLAIDVQQYGEWRSALEARGFRWLGTSDPWHFDFASGTDLRVQSVLAFQQLWNQNHPEDRIAEDGAFGPQMEARLRRSPAGGFARGPSCGAQADCTAEETANAASVACQCVDHHPAGGFCPGTGCSAQEEENCASYGTQCVDHACSGGFGEGHGCTAKEEVNCAAYGTQCVDHLCSGGFGEGHGCTAREERDCAAYGTQCVDHLCSGGFGEGSGCTAKETRDCEGRAQACRDHLCTER